jgi:hypothetical protein
MKHINRRQFGMGRTVVYRRQINGHATGQAFDIQQRAAGAGGRKEGKPAN